MTGRFAFALREPARTNERNYLFSIILIILFLRVKDPAPDRETRDSEAPERRSWDYRLKQKEFMRIFFPNAKKKNSLLAERDRPLYNKYF